MIILKKNSFIELYDVWSFVLCLVPAIQYAIYEDLRYITKYLFQRSLFAIEFFALGLLGKFITTVVIYPLQFCQNVYRY